MTGCKATELAAGMMLVLLIYHTSIYAISGYQPFNRIPRAQLTKPGFANPDDLEVRLSAKGTIGEMETLLCYQGNAYQLRTDPDGHLFLHPSNYPNCHKPFSE